MNFLAASPAGPQPASPPAPAPATAGPGPNSRAIALHPISSLPPPAPDQVLDDLPVSQCEETQDSAPACCRHGSRGRKVRESPLCAPFAPYTQPFTTTRFAPSSPRPPAFKTAPRSRAATSPSPSPTPIAGPPGLCPAQQVWHVLSPEGLYEHHQGAGS